MFFFLQPSDIALDNEHPANLMIHPPGNPVPVVGLPEAGGAVRDVTEGSSPGGACGGDAGEAKGDKVKEDQGQEVMVSGCSSR